MAINFPDSPSVNDTHAVGDKTWRWDGTVWNLIQNNIADHGNLAGLGDDDHTQYLLADGTRTATALTVSGDLTVDTDTLHVDSTNNNVGIGTASPAEPLHVATTSGDAYLRQDNGTATTYLGPDGSNTGLFGTSTAHDVRFITDNSERVRIDSSGNVGIGTTTPSVSLDVEGAILGKSISTPSDAVLNLKGAYSQLQLTDTDDSTYMHYSYSGGKTIHRYNDYTNNIVFTIDGANSRVGINTSTPSGDLTISGPGGREITFLDSGITNVAEMRAHAVDNTSGYAYMQYNAYDHRFAIEGTEVVRVNNNGFLDVDTTIDFTGTTASSANILMSFPHSYALYVDNTGAGTNNTRVWLDGPNGGELILGPRTGANSFGSMRLRSTTIQNEGKTFFGDHLQTGQYSFTQEPWAASTIALGNYGYVGTAGSYGTSLMWNWERGPDSGYYSLGVNSYTSAAAIHLRNDGIRFQYESSWGATSEPSVHTLMAATELLTYKDIRIYEGNPVITLQDSTNTGAHNGEILFKDQSATILGSVRMNGNDDLSVRAETSTSVLYYWVQGNWRFYMTSVQFNPYVDNAYDLGASGKRWDDVYATNTSIIATSDVRDKTDIVDIDYGLDFVNSLRPVNYRMNDRSGYEGTRTHMGFVAQEVSELLGDDATNRAVWVNTPAGEYKNADTGEYESGVERQGLRYSELIAPMVKAIQELTARIEALEES